MNCNRARNCELLLSSGELGRVGRIRLLRHMTACPACREWAADARRISELARQSDSGALHGAGFAARAHQLAGIEVPSPPSRLHARGRVGLAAAAALLLVAGAAALFRLSHREPPTSPAGVARLTENERLLEIAAILSLTRTETEMATEGEWGVEDLAEALLDIEGLAAELPEESSTPPDEHPPITLRPSSTPWLRARTCG